MKIRVLIDYRKLNAATCKDHFPLPFIDQMLERLTGHKYYSFLDGYSGYNQIPIAPENQKSQLSPVHLERLHTDECPLAPAMFQRCMLSLFSDRVERFLEIFMDDFCNAPIPAGTGTLLRRIYAGQKYPHVYTLSISTGKNQRTEASGALYIPTHEYNYRVITRGDLILQ